MAIFIQPGQTFEADVQNLPAGLAGTVGVAIKTAPAGGTVTVARTTAGITEEPAGSGHYGKSNLVAPATGGQYWLFWDSGVNTAPYATEELIVAYTNPATVTGPTFATVEDVEARLGHELTDAETTQVEWLLLAATVMITHVIGKDATWAGGFDVPPLLRRLTVEMVVRAFNNPVGATANREQLGEYSYSQSFGSDYEGLWLTDFERMLLSAAVWGTNSGSARLDSIVFDAEPWT